MLSSFYPEMAQSHSVPGLEWPTVSRFPTMRKTSMTQLPWHSEPWYCSEAFLSQLLVNFFLRGGEAATFTGIQEGGSADASSSVLQREEVSCVATPSWAGWPGVLGPPCPLISQPLTAWMGVEDSPCHNCCCVTPLQPPFLGCPFDPCFQVFLVFLCAGSIYTVVSNMHVPLSQLFANFRGVWREEVAAQFINKRKKLHPL